MAPGAHGPMSTSSHHSLGGSVVAGGRHRSAPLMVSNIKPFEKLQCLPEINSWVHTLIEPIVSTVAILAQGKHWIMRSRNPLFVFPRRFDSE